MPRCLLDAPTARAKAARGSSSRPNVLARKNSISVSVVPSMSPKSAGSTIIARSRFIAWKPSMYPLCMNSHEPARNGWQLVCCTGEPIAARMCAKTCGECTWAATSLRLRSFQAGSMLRKTAGTSPSPYQPTPNPSPLVGSAPSVECMLCTINECSGLYSRSLRSTGAPE